jgi:hypothetical protein
MENDEYNDSEGPKAGFRMLAIIFIVMLVVLVIDGLAWVTRVLRNIYATLLYRANKGNTNDT